VLCLWDRRRASAALRFLVLVFGGICGRWLNSNFHNHVRSYEAVGDLVVGIDREVRDADQLLGLG
jgi:hypothetical protein